MEDPNYWNDKILRRRLSRRRVIQLSALGTLGAITAAAVGCGGEEKASPTAGPASPAATGTPKSTATAGTPINQIFGSGGPAAGQGTTFELGGLLALSGAGSFYGISARRGIDLAVKHIKAAGGPDISILYKDHKSGDPTTGVSAARELGATDKVSALQCDYAALDGAILPVIDQFKILTLDGSGGTTIAHTGEPFFWGTRMITPDNFFAGAFGYLRRELPNAKNVVSLYWDVPVLKDKTKSIAKQAMDKFGFTQVSEETVTLGTNDFSATMARVKDANPDVINLVIYTPDAGYFMKQFALSGMNAQVMGYEYTTDSAQIAGDAYNKLWFAAEIFDADNPKDPWSKFFVDSFKQEYGEPAGFYSANNYENTFVIWELIKRVLAKKGDLSSGEQLQTALVDNPTFTSLYGGSSSAPGKMTFDLTQHTVIKEMLVATIQGGKPVVQGKIDLDGNVQAA